MADDKELAELRTDLNALRSHASNHASLLREITTILNTVSSTLAASNQISAHERESLLTRLDAINVEIGNDRREIAGVLGRIERSIDALDREFETLTKGREEDSGALDEILGHAEVIAEHVQAMRPGLSEALRHTRKLADRDPDTGAEISSSDRAIKALLKAFWAAMATAAILLALSKLLPWVRGVQLP